LAQENFKCPDDYGFYPHHISCDKYWKCDNGAAELKTCGNGLAFEATDPKYLSENCDYHHNVECGDRSQFGKYEVTVLLAIYYERVLCIHNILPHHRLLPESLAPLSPRFRLVIKRHDARAAGSVFGAARLKPLRSGLNNVMHREKKFLVLAFTALSRISQQIVC
jgi:Chitin binding Peritrophin-A domain